MMTQANSNGMEVGGNEAEPTHNKQGQGVLKPPVIGLMGVVPPSPRWHHLHRHIIIPGICKDANLIDANDGLDERA